MANIERADQRPRGGVPQFDGFVPAGQYAAAVGRERNREHCHGVPNRARSLSSPHLVRAGEQKRQQHHERNEKDLSSPELRSFPLARHEVRAPHPDAPRARHYREKPMSCAPSPRRLAPCAPDGRQFGSASGRPNTISSGCHGRASSRPTGLFTLPPTASCPRERGNPEGQGRPRVDPPAELEEEMGGCPPPRSRSAISTPIGRAVRLQHGRRRDGRCRGTLRPGARLSSMPRRTLPVSHRHVNSNAAVKLTTRRSPG